MFRITYLPFIPVDGILSNEVMPYTTSSLAQEISSPDREYRTGSRGNTTGRTGCCRKAEERILRYARPIGPNDRIRVAVIGYGIQGHYDLATALKVPGVELAGICDLYKGRLEGAKELHGKDLFTTQNYLEILQRSDVDAGDYRQQ